MSGWPIRERRGIFERLANLDVHLLPFPGGTMNRRSRVLLICSAAAVASCSSETGGNRRDTMTQRQRDSVLGQSKLPGAGGVAKAMRAADSAKARQALIDSAGRP